MKTTSELTALGFSLTALCTDGTAKVVSFIAHTGWRKVYGRWDTAAARYVITTII